MERGRDKTEQKGRSRGNTEEARHLQAALRTLGTPAFRKWSIDPSSLRMSLPVPLGHMLPHLPRAQSKGKSSKCPVLSASQEVWPLLWAAGLSSYASLATSES